MNVEQLGEWELAVERKYPEKTHLRKTSNTKNPTWSDLGSNSGHRCWKPEYNRVSYGMAHSTIMLPFDPLHYSQW
jgi:hypothetical protein